jgi:hypothetical protein
MPDTALVAVPEPEVGSLNREADDWMDRARTLVVNDQESYDAAGEALHAIARFRKKVEALYAPMKQKTRAAWQAIVDSEKGLLDRAVKADAHLRPAWTAFDEELQRRQRLAQLEAERQAREAEEAQRLEEAAELEAMGETEEAEAVLSRAATPVTVVAPPIAPRTAGISAPIRWKVDERVELMVLVKAVAAGKAPLQCVKPDLPYLNRRASADKDQLRIPGVRVVCVKGTAVRA